MRGLAKYQQLAACSETESQKDVRMPEGQKTWPLANRLLGFLDFLLLLKPLINKCLDFGMALLGCWVCDF
jgi:hypothetical protein